MNFLRPIYPKGFEVDQIENPNSSCHFSIELMKVLLSQPIAGSLSFTVFIGDFELLGEDARDVVNF